MSKKKDNEDKKRDDGVTTHIGVYDHCIQIGLWFGDDIWKDVLKEFMAEKAKEDVLNELDDD